MNILNLDYYYGIEAEQFSFYRIPRLLIKGEQFKSLSSDSKLLYGLMLDRMALSMKNGWLDEENRVYIHYTLDEIMEDLGCAKEKAAKVLAELDSKKGIGLIEKKRQGLGKPDIIYVKNFATFAVEDDDGESENPPEIPSESPSNTDISTEVRKSNFKKFENQTSRSSEIELQEVRKSNFKKFGNRTLIILIITITIISIHLSIHPIFRRMEGWIMGWWISVQKNTVCTCGKILNVTFMVRKTNRILKCTWNFTRSFVTLSVFRVMSYGLKDWMFRMML